MSSEYPSDETIREWTRQLVELLEREHPEQEHEPEGLRMPDQQPAETAPPIRRKRRATAPPGFPTYGKAWPIIQAVATEHDIDELDILSRKRRAPIAVARKAAFKALLAAGYPVYRIARLMDRDHTTVSYGLGRIQRRERESRP